MNILILGSGGREHALAWKIAQSNKVKHIFIAPGNAGTKTIGKNCDIDISNFDSIKQCVLQNSVSMVVVGPEVPLVDGVIDFFISDEKLKNIPIIGPDKKGAQLEGSKDFAKEFLTKYNIPTARYKSFNKNQISEAKAFLDKMPIPFVIKADGLAAGKGVVILEDRVEAEQEIDNMLSGKFGDASSTIVIEEFLSGIEVSYFIITDGNDFVLLPEAKDYKKIGEGDTGLNTGGTGAVSPVPFATKEFTDKVINSIIKPTLRGLKNEEICYKGFLFFGLINVAGNPFVIEYNCRLGDPETEVVIPRIKNDLIPILEACYNGTIKNHAINIINDAATTVMLVSNGYPEHYEKDKPIYDLNTIMDSIPFHAGTKTIENQIVTNGGRVIALTSLGTTISSALKKSYDSAKKISFEGKNYRNDIGFDL